MVLILLSVTGCRKAEKEQIPVVTTDSVSCITSTSAKCIGDVISCGGSWWVNRGFCLSNIITDLTISDFYLWCDAGSHTGSYSGLLTYLTPGTTYYVCAYALSEAGIGYGDVISFTTTGNITDDIEFNPDLTYGTLNDIDGNTYNTINIGDQTWMAENLKTTKYNDGTGIPLVTDLSDWVNLSTPGYCWYLNDKGKYKDVYGALYNWHTVNTGKLCPTGWHVPSDADWTTLTSFLGGENVAGGKMKEAGATHWVTEGMVTTNSSGFTALPGGQRLGTKSDPVLYFINMGYSGSFWSSSEYNDPVYGFYGSYTREVFSGDYEGCDRGAYTKSWGLSVRCVED